VTVRFVILTGSRTGSYLQTDQFPFSVGRDAGDDLVFEEEGVWGRHVQVDLQQPDGFLLRGRPEALISVNNQPAQQAFLRNGDIIDIGAVKLQFWLAEARRPMSRIGEALTWLCLAAVSIVQVVLLVRLLR
jgi:hypothetical protein